MNRPWVPRPSEIIRINFSPVAGHEQAKARPAVVLSAQGFNDKSDLLVCVPCTTKVKGHPFEVAIGALAEPSVALSHHIRTMDWRQRQAIPVGFAAVEEMAEIRQRIQALLGL